MGRKLHRWVGCSALAVAMGMPALAQAPQAPAPGRAAAPPSFVRPATPFPETARIPALDAPLGPEPSPSSWNTGRLLAKSFFSLFVILALIYVLYGALRYWRRPSRPAPGARIRVLDRAALDGDKAIYVVALGSKVVVLGLSSGSMSLLCELQPEDAKQFVKDDGAEAIAELPDQDRPS